MQNIHLLIEYMWEHYLELNSDARKIHTLFSSLNHGVVVNDHIALRTFNLEKVSIPKIASPFIEAGYVLGGDYHFPEKKLYAQYYQHKDPQLPKIFISELLVEQLSDDTQRQIHQLVNQIDPLRVAQDEFCFSGRPWLIDYQDYCQLLSESEYAAWMSAFGYQPNHFTVSVNHLSGFQNVTEVAEFLIDQGFLLNSAGGLIKGSAEVCLEQISTMANKVRVHFNDKDVFIPSCYYEFAYRYPMANGEIYQGFVAQSADKIFESTDSVE